MAAQTNGKSRLGNDKLREQIRVNVYKAGMLYTRIADLLGMMTLTRPFSAHA